MKKSLTAIFSKFLPISLVAGFHLGIATNLVATELPEGIQKIDALGGIESYELTSNGLQILLMPNQQLPVAAVMVTYNVGGRDEVAGTTGATHILEHMMFKGTTNFSGDSGYSKTMERIGARSNATTYYDRTNYYAVLPSENVNLAIQLEADRMRNLQIQEADLASEMTVVRNEYERGENNPVRTLIKEIYATAFMAHPYGHPVIGWRSDIENSTTEKLRRFYDTYYWPENTTLSVIGGFDRAETLKAIVKHYGALPRPPQPIPTVQTLEPEQLGERRLKIARAGEVGVLALAHKVPEGKHEDWAALRLIEQILGANQTGRLYRALDDNGKASHTFSFAPQLRDPSLFFLGAYLTADSTHVATEALILQEIDNLIASGVSEAELKRAKSVIEAQTVYDRDGPFAIASAINECIALGDWSQYITLPQAIQKVDAAEIQRVAKKYLQPKARTTGYFIAQKKPLKTVNGLPQPNYFRNPAMQISEPESTPPTVDKESPTTPSNLVQFSPHIQESQIGPIRLIAVDMPIDKVVSFVGSFAAGNAQNPKDNPLLAGLTAQMLDQGTEKNDRFVLAESLDTLGATIKFDSSNHSLSFSGKFLRESAGFVIDLLAEQLRQPSFDAQAFEALKQRTYSNILRATHDPDYRADTALNRALYPVDHPNFEPDIEQQLKALEATTAEDLREFHDRVYGPQSMTLVFAGDIDFEQLCAAVATAFNDWSGGTGYLKAGDVPEATAPTATSISILDKTSVSVRLGHYTGLQRTDPEYIPFALGNYILGGSFHSRLMSEVRVKKGLTYSIRSGHSGDILTPGNWSLSASFSPELLEEGKSVTQSVLQDWIHHGVTAQEVEAAVTTLKGKYLVGLATTTAVAGQVHSFVQRGYPAEYIDVYPQKLDTLTPAAVNSSIRSHFNIETLSTVEAGSLP
jgi:zinc protease